MALQTKRAVNGRLDELLARVELIEELLSFARASTPERHDD